MSFDLLKNSVLQLPTVLQPRTRDSNGHSQVMGWQDHPTTQSPDARNPIDSWHALKLQRLLCAWLINRFSENPGKSRNCFGTVLF